jgi:serine/threonine protein kinase
MDAVKIIDLRADIYDEVANKQKLRAARHEAAIWRRLGKHENLVTLHEVFVDLSLYFMVMEKCECSVMSRLTDMPNTNESDLAGVFSNMLAALAHLHLQRIAHRDIKPDNYLYGGHDNTIKLCDFGMAAILPKSGKLYGRCGTAPYMSPEMVGDAAYSTKTDIWSLGVTCYLMLYGKFPYEARGYDEMVRAIDRGSPAPDYQSSPQPTNAAKSFVSTLLNRQASARPTADMTAQLPYLSLGQYSSHNMQAVIHSGQEVGKEFQVRADPTQERTLDVLLEKLQAKQVKFFSEGYFSEGPKQEDGKETTKEKERSQLRRPTRASTFTFDGSSTHTTLYSKLRDLDTISESTHEGKSECDQCSDSTKSFHDISLSVDGGKHVCCLHIFIYRGSCLAQKLRHKSEHRLVAIRPFCFFIMGK